MRCIYCARSYTLSKGTNPNFSHSAMSAFSSFGPTISITSFLRVETSRRSLSNLSGTDALQMSLSHPSPSSPQAATRTSTSPRRRRNRTTRRLLTPRTLPPNGRKNRPRRGFGVSRISSQTRTMSRRPQRVHPRVPLGCLHRYTMALASRCHSVSGLPFPYYPPLPNPISLSFHRKRYIRPTARVAP